MLKIKKNDTIVVLAGKDKGKTGKVLKVYPKTRKSIVEGINFVKKHARKTREDQKGGIIQKEAPIHISNIAVFCKGCTKPTKVGYNILKDGTKSRYCKKCNEVF
ncbi:MAG: 50S ribosomal protein L24 [Candidatus Omnitrophica bacterium]|nr:50S ribosomal protein L24 [Candidatus Omnitrophota bacterium]